MRKPISEKEFINLLHTTIQSSYPTVTGLEILEVFPITRVKFAKGIDTELMNLVSNSVHETKKRLGRDYILTDIGCCSHI